MPAELPITRLVRYLMHRGSRPSGTQPCASCGTAVPEGTGEWDPGYREILCDDEHCALEARAGRSW